MKESKALYRQLYHAYYTARKHKRRKAEQIAFELNYEQELYDLYEAIMQRTYEPLPSRVFVTKKPVIREIFAPRFRDRVVHHLIYNYIYQHLDRQFIYDCYSCRVGKGTLFGIDRAQKMLRRATKNYTQDAYVLKLDISGYFMNINRSILRHKIEAMMQYETLDITRTEQEALRYLIQKVVLHNAALHAVRCSPLHYWKRIPASKSLFCTDAACGLPIGSLTSQLFSNVYLNEIDHQIKAHFTYYGRYVDDLLLIDTDKEKLLRFIPIINDWLAATQLQLHPQKVYLQHYSKGFYFLGQYIKPHRTYISKRVKKHISQFVQQINRTAVVNEKGQIDIQALAMLENHINSYLGILSKANTYNYLTKILEQLPKWIHQFADFSITKQHYRMALKPPYKLKNNYECLYPTSCI